MIDASTKIDPQRGGRRQTAIVIVAGLLLAALIAWATWKAVTYSSRAIKIGVQPLPALDIGKGRVWITHGENSNDWVIHSTDAAGVNMIVHRNEFLGLYTYEFQSTRLNRGGTAAGGRGGNRFGGGAAAGARGQAQVSPAITSVLSHAKELKLTDDQKTQISALDLSDFPLAAIDKTQKTHFQDTAIQQWLDLLAATDEKGKTSAEWALHSTLETMGTKLAGFTQYPNAILDVDLCDGDSPILTPDQIVIYRKIEKQATTPATVPANTRGGAIGNRGTPTTAPAARGNNTGNRAGATTAPAARGNATGNRGTNTPATTNRAGARTAAPPASTPPLTAPRSGTPAASAPPTPAVPASRPAANP